MKGASFLLGDITELETFKEIAPGSLDLVTCYGVFIHLESMAAFKQCMRNLYSLLRPGEPGNYLKSDSNHVCLRNQ